MSLKLLGIYRSSTNNYHGTKCEPKEREPTVITIERRIFRLDTRETSMLLYWTEHRSRSTIETCEFRNAILFKGQLFQRLVTLYDRSFFSF
ncbi:hypothetical protein PUN28_006201 [Cardiocondyla obscurior]|uniref:Uncharacterized protein n=1 Tax=Cardiocondyla obscurior TaxID=286306 RepID=A0AAW2G7I8_9HYME